MDGDLKLGWSDPKVSTLLLQHVVEGRYIGDAPMTLEVATSERADEGFHIRQVANSCQADVNARRCFQSHC